MRWCHNGSVGSKRWPLDPDAFSGYWIILYYLREFCLVLLTSSWPLARVGGGKIHSDFPRFRPALANRVLRAMASIVGSRQLPNASPKQLPEPK